jgi:hypothetical protein
LVGEGHTVELVLLSDANASDYVSRTTLPIFEEDRSGRPAWGEMDSSAVKHDTFVYSATGERLLFWDASSNSLGDWSADIRSVVEAQAQ